MDIYITINLSILYIIFIIIIIINKYKLINN